MKRLIFVLCGLVFLQLFAIAALAQEQQFASIGDLKLQNGGVIRNCRIGYRTFGKLNSNKSNVVVFPTWAGGTTEQLQSSIGPGRLVDSTTYFVVAIALSNGRLPCALTCSVMIYAFCDAARGNDGIERRLGLARTIE